MANPHTGYFTGKWNITIPEVEHGTVTCSKQVAFTNETVTLTVTPDSGYELLQLIVETDDGSAPAGSDSKLTPRRDPVEVTLDDNGDYKFKMPPSPVTVSATFDAATITGVRNPGTDPSPSGTRCNIMGQPVDKSYKGFVIENGIKKTSASTPGRAMQPGTMPQIECNLSCTQSKRGCVNILAHPFLRFFLA